MSRTKSISINGIFGRDKYIEYIQYSSREHHFGRPEVSTAGQSFRVNYKKGVSYPYPVYIHSSRDKYTVRRTPADIRLEPAEMCALVIVISGKMIVNQGGRSLLVTEDELVLMPMNKPYAVEHVPASRAPFKVIYTVLPARTINPDGSLLDLPRLIDIRVDHVRTLRALFSVLLEHGDALSYSSARSIFDAIFGQLIPIRTKDGCQGMTRSSQDAGSIDDRWHGALSYIYMMYSNRLLDAASTARALDISKRSLAYLFRQHGTTFSRVLWDFRLSLARDWLLAPAMQNITIQQLAFAAGFKSAAHFSTLFKARMNCSPKNFRAAAKKEPPR